MCQLLLCTVIGNLLVGALLALSNGLGAFALRSLLFNQLLARGVANSALACCPLLFKCQQFGERALDSGLLRNRRASSSPYECMSSA